MKPWMELVDELIGNARESMVYIEALVVRGGFHMVSAEYSDAIDIADTALQALKGIDRPDLVARAYDVKGCSRCGLDDKGGLEDQRRAVALAREARSLWEFHHAINNTIVSYTGFGMLREAEALADEWGRLFDEVGGTHFNRLWYFITKAEALYDRGRWDESLELCDRFLVALTPGVTHILEPEARFLRGIIAFARGATEDAFDELDRATVDKDADAQVIGSALTARASALAILGRRAEAAEAFDDVMRLGRMVFTFICANTTLTDLTLVAVALGRAEEISAALDRSPRSGWTASAQAILRGDYAGAADLLAEMGDRRGEADVRLRAGGAHLHAALEFYRSVGATRFIRAAEALLGASA
jgi:tetratricopeptide (TPR) repeat protein